MEGPYIRIEETGDVIPLTETVTTVGRGSGVCLLYTSDAADE